MRVSPGLARCRIDQRVSGLELAGLHIPDRRQPAICLLANLPQHSRLVASNPDWDVMGGERPALGAVNIIRFPGEVQRRAVAGVPHAANDIDGLTECHDGLTWC